jgi:hypothetical protein
MYVNNPSVFPARRTELAVALYVAAPLAWFVSRSPSPVYVGDQIELLVHACAACIASYRARVSQRLRAWTGNRPACKRFIHRR